jgi:hypothetical protein
MTLITSAQQLQLLANARATAAAELLHKSVDHYPVVRLYTPVINAIWLPTDKSGTAVLEPPKVDPQGEVPGRRRVT